LGDRRSVTTAGVPVTTSSPNGVVGSLQAIASALREASGDAAC
jgi:hypothetical protein